MAYKNALSVRRVEPRAGRIVRAGNLKTSTAPPPPPRPPPPPPAKPPSPPGTNDCSTVSDSTKLREAFVASPTLISGLCHNTAILPRRKAGAQPHPGGCPLLSGDEEQFEQNGDSPKAERDAAAQRLNREDTSNVLPLNLSEPPLRSGALSKSTAVSKDVASATGDTPPGTIAEDVRRDAGTTQPGKDGTEPTSLKQEVEKGPNDPRSEIISTKGTLESELAGTEKGFRIDAA